MYHLALAFTVLVPASLIVLARRPDQEPLAVGQQRIHTEKEHHGQADHDENHRRSEPGFLPARPRDLRDLAADLAEERQRIAARTRGRRQILARPGRRLLCRVRHMLFDQSVKLLWPTASLLEAVLWPTASLLEA